MTTDPKLTIINQEGEEPPLRLRILAAALLGWAESLEEHGRTGELLISPQVMAKDLRQAASVIRKYVAQKTS